VVRASLAQREAASPNVQERTLTYVSCNYCGRQITQGVHNITRLVRCMECGLIFVNPRPGFAELATQYESEYFQCDAPVFGGYENYEGDRENILRTFRRRLGRVMAQAPCAAPRLLDVGCATGLFLEVARDAGAKAEGLDLSGFAVEQARNKGFTVRQGQLADAGLADGSFDVLTMWDIIEHVTDPQGLLKECHRVLAPGGALAISTPDAGSWLAWLLGGRWLGYRSLDEHLYFFSRASLARMLDAAGFEGADAFSVGKYLSLERLITRLRYYTRIGALLLRSVDRVVPELSLYVNPFDTMCIVARKKATRTTRP
jgi:2-polyprenyl-3-methyl-5-hydroxy-6-metoxy-1,4-benzoquinol methylase/ribosomal protein S27E